MVDLPEPVTPQSSTIPCGCIAISLMIGGRCSFSNGRMLLVMRRAATEIFPRAMNRFTRKRQLSS